MAEIFREHFRLKETIVTICAREREHIEGAKKSIARQRSYLEEFIGNDPFFMVTLEPYELLENDAPDIVKRMVESSSIIGVGPMACVAGAIAGFAVDAMIDAGATYAVVDNGGDICILNDVPIIVGIYAVSSLIRDLALEIPARGKPLGICTSSGTVGPSISFGCADAATVISEDLALADAAATALGNAVHAAGSLKECFNAVDRPGISGALLIRGEEMALWGELPKLLRAHVSEERITRA